MLLARRLVEAGVRLVTVDLRWWDTHVKGFESLRLGFLPRWDRAYTALIEDLDARGLLESTLVLAWGEFGRTPRSTTTPAATTTPTSSAPRWRAARSRAAAWSASRTPRARSRKANPKTPQDVLATLYQHLGVDTEAQYLEQRPPHPGAAEREAD